MNTPGNTPFAHRNTDGAKHQDAGRIFDVVVIGAGIVGSAIARQMAAYELSVAIVDGREDVGEGTSKANTAILHTGFDANPGTLESLLVHRGYHLLGAYAEQTGIPVERTGAILVAWDTEQLETLPSLQEKAARNGYPHTELISSEEVYNQLPHIGPGGLGGLTVPGESIICTWTTNFALATDAVQRGATLLLGRWVESVDHLEEYTVLHTNCGDVTATWVINAAGLGGDRIDRMFGHDRFHITPRRGELLVFDKQARPLVDKIVLPVPTALGKGVLISPTVYGNVMLGPTAEDLTDRTDTGTSAAGFEFLLTKGEKLMPQLLEEEVTATYAGLRAASDSPDYIINLDLNQRYVLAGGIRSTGLSSGMAVAEYIDELLANSGRLALTKRTDLPAPPDMPNIGEAFLRPYQDTQRIARDSAYGKIVCFCERVTAGEIRDAFTSPLPPTTLEGLRRRTRAQNGRCQGFFCGAEVSELLQTRGGVAKKVKRVMTESAAATATYGTRPSAVLTPDVLIVGAGPSGLRAAADLAPTVSGEVIVVERENIAGGIPRHSHHLGYGIRDMRTFITGPHYAQVLREKAISAGATIMTNAMATDWAGPRSLNVTTPEGRLCIDARAIVLATGARERPRPARLIPGDRARGVYSTGHLQNVVYLKHGQVGTRAVVVGSELVSWSAVVTLRHAGCRTVLMTTQYPRSDSYWVFNRPGRIAFRTKVATRTRVTRILGRPNVTGVEIENLDSGERLIIECDTVILTGDWIPDNELARAAGIAIDPHTKGPRVDTALRTDAPGVFAIGNCLHPVDTADTAALDGAAVAEHVRRHLATETTPAPGVELRAEAPFRWVTPHMIRPGDPAPPRNRLLLWTDRFVRTPRIALTQDGKTIVQRRVWWPAAPGRVFRVPADILKNIDPTGGPVTIGLKT